MRVHPAKGLSETLGLMNPRSLFLLGVSVSGVGLVALVVRVLAVAQSMRWNDGLVVLLLEDQGRPLAPFSPRTASGSLPVFVTNIWSL